MQVATSRGRNPPNCQRKTALADKKRFLSAKTESGCLSPTIILRSGTSTVSVNSITAVRITLPNHTSILSLLDILVVETASSSKVDGS
jgi:hypothetical protein